MNTLLKREFAPIPEAAWAMIDAEASRILKGNLSARALVDFSGPHGPEKAAVNLGSVTALDDASVAGVAWGLRDVLPLAEFRAPFALSMADLDQVARGGVTPDLSAVVAAAQKAALFEEKALYFGLSKDRMQGLLTASTHKPVALPKEAQGYPVVLEAAVHNLQRNGIGGPYHLVMGRQAFQALAAGDTHGYPLRKRIGDLLNGGSVRWSPALEGGALLSGRGGDAELTVGQDYAVGFSGADGDKISLYLMASFAFRVLEPAAAIELKPAKA